MFVGFSFLCLLISPCQFSVTFTLCYACWCFSFSPHQFMSILWRLLSVLCFGVFFSLSPHQSTSILYSVYSLLCLMFSFLRFSLSPCKFSVTFILCYVCWCFLFFVSSSVHCISLYNLLTVMSVSVFPVLLFSSSLFCLTFIHCYVYLVALPCLLFSLYYLTSTHCYAFRFLLFSLQFLSFLCNIKSMYLLFVFFFFFVSSAVYANSL